MNKLSTNGASLALPPSLQASVKEDLQGEISNNVDLEKQKELLLHQTVAAVCGRGRKREDKGAMSLGLFVDPIICPSYINLDLPRHPTILTSPDVPTPSAGTAPSPTKSTSSSPLLQSREAFLFPLMRIFTRKKRGESVVMVVVLVHRKEDEFGSVSRKRESPEMTALVTPEIFQGAK
ncbi:hypothetical protein Fcan01_19507 [Folsomia candida]|uniref:Uncharacterized protein n=1 Tax=Folsomia candida TaxID=158441 RepID=A0A226DKM7_FOLCA|nr:hypothetical protein Fcan01_19507 [Folsomia candida]